MPHFKIMQVEPIKERPRKWSRIAEKRFNQQLKDFFGVDTASGKQMWRIVWSDDEYEMRLTEYSDGGVLLLRPEVRLLPKYKQWNAHRYVLEHLVAVPDINLIDIPTSKISYEPIYTFMDGNENYLPPNMFIAKYQINLVESAIELARTGRNKSKSFRKFIDEEFSQEASLAAKEKRVNEIVEYLWGDQSALGGTTKTGETIIVPRNYERF